jgi:nucleoid-associated protein YgaU
MGIFDFVSNAGARIFGKDKEPEENVIDPQKIKMEAEAAKAKALTDQVKAHEFEIEGLKIEFSDHVATLYGKIPTQADKEKIILTVGNVNGVAKVDDRMEVLRKEPEARFYTVKPGDTLSRIAKEFYGNAMKYPVIFEANKPMLRNPDKIYPGQVLRIPAAE